jgi:carboxymethylenebutenolidase
VDRIYVMQLVRSFQVGELNRDQFMAQAIPAVGEVPARMLLGACTPRPNFLPSPVLIRYPTAVEIDEAGGSRAPAQPMRHAWAAAAGVGALDRVGGPLNRVGSDEDTGQVSAGPVANANVTYQSPDGQTLNGYLARPDDSEQHRAVIVIQEWWGLNDNIRDITRRMAGQGFVALAPDLYHGQSVSEPDEARKLVMQLDQAAAVQEISAAMTYLLAQPFVQGGKVGVMGFCMGGGLALQMGLHDDRTGAVVSFYGRPIQPEQAKDFKAPLLGLYAGRDHGIPVEAVRAMQNAFDKAGILCHIHIYEHAEHAFFNNTRDSYNPTAAYDAWLRTVTFFKLRLPK